MNYIYIGAAIIAGLLIGFITLAIAWMTARVSGNIRKKAAELISEYDELIEDRSEELKKLQKEIDEKKEKLEILEGKEERLTAPVPAEKSVEEENSVSILRITEKFATTKYREKDTAEIYQEIRNGFKRDPDETIRRMISEDIEAGTAKRSVATELLEGLSYDIVYEISRMPAEDQYRILKNTLDEKGLALLKEYKDINVKFSMIGFYDWLKSKAMEEKQVIRLYVPDPELVKGRLPEQVEVIGDREIIEGFQIVAGSRLYDYSIKRKEIS